METRSSRSPVREAKERKGGILMAAPLLIMEVR